MKSFVSPRDLIELRIAQICEDVFGKWIGMKDALCEDGEDVAAARAVLDAVEEQLGVAVPLSTLRREPTIAAIARCLRPKLERLLAEPLVPLQPKGSKRPFFFVPCGEGNVFPYHDLARRLAPDQPFYGLQARGLYGEAPPLDSVEEMAAAHVEVIRAVQPHGPYLLGGHCTGTAIAFEMALQLERRGERVALLATIDALAPSLFYEYVAETKPLDDPVEVYMMLEQGIESWLGREMGIDRKEMVSLDPGRRKAHFMALARGIDAFPEDAGDDRLDHAVDTFQRITLATYAPEGVISGRIVLFGASESFLCVPPSGGWESASREPVRVHKVPGNHITLLTEPNVGILSQRLRAEIAEAGVS